MFTAATKPVIKPHWSHYQPGLARNTCVIPGYQTVITWQELAASKMKCVASRGVNCGVVMGLFAERPLEEANAGAVEYRV